MGGGDRNGKGEGEGGRGWGYGGRDGGRMIIECN